MTRRTIHDMVREAKAEIEELSVDELQAEMTAGSCTVIDIRDIRERVEMGSIPGAVSHPRGMLEFWFDPESPYYRGHQLDDRFVFYCAGGLRSALATKAIQDLGFTNVAHLEPGFGGWKDADAEIEDVASTSKWVKREA
ncbi:MAG: rhodanese-like domain-containing protein [Actinomycetota bacterium]